MSGGLDWSKAAVRQTHAVGAGELPGPFAALGQRGRSVSQQTQAPDLWASVRDNPSLPQVRSGGAPAPMEVEPWGCGGGCGSKGSATPSRPSRSAQQEEADALPWIFAGLGQRGQRSAAKAEPYDLWAPLRQGGQSGAESCGCQDQAPRKQAQQQTGGQTVKIVSGDWLAEVMRLDAETAQQIVGQEVHLDAEAWGAVRAVQRAQVQAKVVHARISRRRKEIWPEDRHGEDGDGLANPESPKKDQAWFQQGDLPDGSLGDGSPGLEKLYGCACHAMLGGGVRFVDSELGDDMNTGTVGVPSGTGPPWSLKPGPWKTLRKVEAWLNDLANAANEAGACVGPTVVLLHRDRVWDGTEEAGSGLDPFIVYLNWSDPNCPPILDIQQFKATSPYPLTLSAYGALFGDGKHPSGRLQQRPVIAGMVATAGDSAPPAVYKDTRVGIRLNDCCYVLVSNLTIRSFGAGIVVQGYSKHHLYTNLYLHAHAYVGFAAGVPQSASYVRNIAWDEDYYRDQDHVDELAAWVGGVILEGAPLLKM